MHTSKEFIGYIKRNYKEIKNISNIEEKHIIEYLQKRQEQGKSPYTISKDMAALNKLFNCKITKKDAGIKQRSYKKVTRSRTEKAHDKKYNPENYKEQILFAKATGCRRESILKVKPDDIILDSKGIPEKVYLKEKGGKERYATILQKYREDIKEIMKNKDKGKPMFEKYTSKIDNHAFRGEYARARYKELIDKKGKDNKDFRAYDKSTLEILKKALGHTRIDVVQQN